jgi:hypothetical protein
LIWPGIQVLGDQVREDDFSTRGIELDKLGEIRWVEYEPRAGQLRPFERQVGVLVQFYRLSSGSVAFEDGIDSVDREQIQDGKRSSTLCEDRD